MWRFMARVILRATAFCAAAACAVAQPVDTTRLDRAHAAIETGAYADAIALLSGRTAPTSEKIKASEAALMVEALLGSGNYVSAVSSARQAVGLVEQAFGKGPEFADAMLLLARTEMQQSGGDATRAALERALAAAREADGGESLRVLRAIDRIAVALSAAGQSAEAERMMRDVLDKSTRLQPDPLRDRLRFTNTLGIALLRQSKFDAARAEFASAYEGRSRLLSPRHAETLESEHNLAVALRRLGQQQSASEVLERVIAVRKNVLGADHPDTLTSRNIMVRQLRDRGQFTAAETEARDIVQTLSRKVGPSHRKTIEARGDLGQVLFQSGKRPEGLKVYEETFENATVQLGEADPEVMSLGHEFAGLLVEAGRLPEALRALNRVLEPTRKMLGDVNRDTLATLNSIARIQQDLGRLEEAERIYQYVLRVMDQQVSREDTDRVTVLNGLGAVQREKGAAAEALRSFEEVVRVRTKRLGLENPRTLVARSNQAAALSKLRRFPEALAIHRDVLSIRERVFPKAHPDTLRSLHNIASTLDESGDTANAHSAFEEVLRLRLEILGPTHPDTIVSIRGLAGVLYTMGDLPKARERYREVKSAAETVRAQGRLPDELQRSLFASLAPAYRMLAFIEAELGNFAGAFDVTELSKARTILEQTAIRTAVRASVLSEAEQLQLVAVETESARLDNQIADIAQDPVQRAVLEARRNEVTETFLRLHGALRVKYPKYEAATEVRIATTADIPMMLPANTAFLQFVNLGPRTLVLWATGSGEQGMEQLPAMPGLATTIEAYRAVLAKPKGVEDLRYPAAHGEPRYWVWKLKDGSFQLRQSELGAIPDAEWIQDVADIRARLSEILIAPLPGAVKRMQNWIVSPDGPLALLPFDTLLLDGELLVMHREISSVQSLSMLKLLIEKGHEYAGLARAPLLAMGDPIYPVSQAPPEPTSTPIAKTGADRQLSEALEAARPQQIKKWEQLPGAAKELEVLTEMFQLRDGYSRFARAAASEQTIRMLDRSGALSGYRYVQFATHGALNMDDPRLSAIVLSQTKLDEENDGYLRAAELMSFNFRSDLAVISSCESAVGSWLAGEGILGLPFALYVAGNRSTLLTLWPIYDASTADFMRRFYTKLNAGASIGHALTATKREFITGEAGDKVRAPAYWAAFSLFGIPF